MQITVPICDLRLKPNLNSNLETQFLFGERIEIIHEDKNWLFCKSIDDNYKGYLKRQDIGEVQNTNYRISSLSCFIYKSPSIKSRVISKLFLNSKILASKFDEEWLEICFKGKKYFIHNNDLCLKEKYIDLSWVEIAISFLNTPYMWGGKSHLGLDCSALVQLAFQSVNKFA